MSEEGSVGGAEMGAASIRILLIRFYHFERRAQPIRRPVVKLLFKLRTLPKRARFRVPNDDDDSAKAPGLRNELLALHKALVDSERVTYEQTIGTIPSPNHFLQLLTRDPWFAWLQPFSQLIVVMDEALDEKEPLTSAVEALFQQARRLLVVSEEGDGFSKHYFDALQRDPDVVLAHAAVAKLLGARKGLA